MSHSSNVPEPPPESVPEFWYARGMDAFLNRWFARYEDARASLESEGGYLLPFRRQFFVCGADAVRLLGLDPDDPDWARVGWDCVRPADEAACERLRQRCWDTSQTPETGRTRPGA